MYAGKLVEKATAAQITEDPQHPYTQMLIGSLPEVGVRFEEKRLHAFLGRPPSLLLTAARLSLQGALSAGGAGVRGGAALGRDGAGAVRRLLEGGCGLMLELAGVTKVFKTGFFGREETTAVADVSLVVRPGEVVSLIGESGSGKTTIGRMALRLTGATAGTVPVADQDVLCLGKSQLRSYYAHVQGVFQDPFSSYNPVYKVDRVLGMVRANYLPELDAAAWHEKLDASLRAVTLEPV